MTEIDWAYLPATVTIELKKPDSRPIEEKWNDYFDKKKKESEEGWRAFLNWLSTED